MCVIATHPAGKPLTATHLKRMALANPDGGGFAYTNEGKVVIAKGFMEYAPFEAAYMAATAAHKDTPFVVHFRIRTHGALDAERTHPFAIGSLPEGQRPALAHNGYIPCVGEHAVMSDTQLLVESFPLLFERKEALIKAVANGLATHLGNSKLAVLYADGEILYVNKERGCDDDQGRWYSNTSWDYRSYTDRDDQEGALVPRNNDYGHIPYASGYKFYGRGGY